MKKALLTFTLLFCLIVSNSLKAQNLPLYQYYKSSIHKHFYTTNFNELGNGTGGWVYQGSIGKLNSGYSQTSQKPVYRFYQSSSYAHYYTTNPNVYPGGFQLEGIIGYTNPIVVIQTNVYEFYGSGDYYYSTNSTPPSGYTLNGVAFQIGYD